MVGNNCLDLGIQPWLRMIYLRSYKFDERLSLAFSICVYDARQFYVDAGIGINENRILVCSNLKHQKKNGDSQKW